MINFKRIKEISTNNFIPLCITIIAFLGLAHSIVTFVNSKADIENGVNDIKTIIENIDTGPISAKEETIPTKCVDGVEYLYDPLRHTIITGHFKQDGTLYKCQN